MHFVFKRAHYHVEDRPGLESRQEVRPSEDLTQEKDPNPFFLMSLSSHIQR